MDHVATDVGEAEIAAFVVIGELLVVDPERYFLRSGSTAGEFVEAGIAALAPAGTATVQCQVLLNACGMPTGSIVVDDAALLIGRE